MYLILIRYTWPNLNCTGNETDIANCTYERFRGCQRDNYLGYAAVSCYNGTLKKGNDLHQELGLSYTYFFILYMYTNED